MKKFISITLALVIATMTFAFAGCGKTETPATDLEYIKEKGTLVIGITDFDPMDYKDENSEWTGFDVDYAKAVCEKLGVTPEFKEIVWEQKETSLETKVIDCIWNGMTITDGIKAAADVSGAYMDNYQVIVVKDAATYTSIESLAGKTIVAEQGSAGETAAKANESLAKGYKAVEAQADALLQVKSGQADACVIDYIMAASMLREGKSYDTLSIIEGVKLGETESYGIAFRTGSDVVAKVDEITAQLVADGTLKTIADKYKLGDSVVTTFTAGVNN